MSIPCRLRALHVVALPILVSACTPLPGTRAERSAVAAPTTAASPFPREASASDTVPGFEVRFAEDGRVSVRDTSRTDAPYLGIRTRRIGRGPASNPGREGVVRLERAPNGARYHRATEGVVEWYVVRGRELEQGFTLATRPLGQGPLRFELEFEGSVPNARGDDRLALLDEASREVFSYGDIYARDARGRSLPIHVDALGRTATLVVDDRRAMYPIVVDPTVWGVRTELRGSPVMANSAVGRSVAIARDTVVLGVPQADTATGVDSGTALVYRVSNDVWTLEATLVPSSAHAGANFGGSVALFSDGTRTYAGIGAPRDGASTGGGSQPGRVFVYERSGSSWQEKAILAPSNGTAQAGFGSSLAFVATALAVGAPRQNEATAATAGSVYVYRRDAFGAWGNESQVHPPSPEIGGGFGGAVAMTGTTLAVGSPGATAGGVGSRATQGVVEVFTTTDFASFTPLQTLDSIGDPASSGGDRFGTSVAMSGNLLAAGAPDVTNGSATGAGVVYVFQNPGSGFVADTRLVVSNPATGDGFGTSLAMDGTLLVAGAPQRATRGLIGEGAAYVFDRASGSYDAGSLLGTLVTGSDSVFGTSVGVTAVSGMSPFLLAGAPGYSADGTVGAGAGFVYVFAAALGDSCSQGTSCASGICVDGVCCNVSCGGSDPTDCLACSVAAGASSNGLCAVRDLPGCVVQGDGGGTPRPSVPRTVTSCACRIDGAGSEPGPMGELVFVAVVAGAVARSGRRGRRRARNAAPQ